MNDHGTYLQPLILFYSFLAFDTLADGPVLLELREGGCEEGAVRMLGFGLVGEEGNFAFLVSSYGEIPVCLNMKRYVCTWLPAEIASELLPHGRPDMPHR